MSVTEKVVPVNDKAVPAKYVVFVSVSGGTTQVPSALKYFVVPPPLNGASPLTVDVNTEYVVLVSVGVAHVKVPSPSNEGIVP